MGLHFIKNGTKHDVCVKRPSLFPASATTYDNSQSGLSATRVQGAIDELAKPPVETLTFADVITMATGITAQTGSYAKKVGNKIYVHILGSGSLTFGPNGSIQIATISSDYRPRVRQAGNTLINPATTGQNYGSCGVGIYESGNLALAYGTGSATIGNASYPWTTSSGIDVCWEL